MTTIRLTMAQALIRFLDQQYFSMDGQEHKLVEGIFSIFGHGNVTGIGEALEYTDHQLKFIRGNNEQGMVHAATAFAKQHNRSKIYAVTSSIGPGATNMVTGAATATINRLPVLLLPGDIFASRAPDPVLQQLEHPTSHDISVNECLRPVSRYYDRINRPEQLMTAMLKAFAILTDPALTGAVTICLPQDVQCESFDYPLEFFKKRIHVLDRRRPNDNLIKKAADLIRHSERPLIIAGGGVHYSLAYKELNDFAHNHFIPVAETQAGKSALLYDAEMNIGGIGVMGTAVANRLAQKADCIIAIGTRLSDFVTSSKSALVGHMININVDPFDGLKLEPAIAINADAKLALDELDTELAKTGYKTDPNYQQLIYQEKAVWLKEQNSLINSHKTNDVLLHQLSVLGCLNEHCDQDAVVVAAAGSLPGDLQRLWQAKSIKGYHLEYGYSCMGYEIAGALGVKMAEPHREVWALLGDGSFLMMHSEIVTAVQEGLKINILLFDSGGFNCIKGLQTAHGSAGFGTDLRFRNSHTQKLDGDIISINFAKYAEGLGLKTYRSTNMAELKEHILSAQREKSSTLIEVKIAPGSQSCGYHTWWHVAVSDTSNCKQVIKAQEAMAQAKKTARLY